MRILYVHYPGHREEDQQETKDFISSLSNNPDYEVEDISVDKMEANISIAYHWGLGKPFIIIEEDKVPTLEQLDEVANCEEPFCTSDYMLPISRMGTPTPVHQCRIIVRGNPTHIDELRQINKDDKYCDLFGTGLLKITPFGKYPFDKERYVAIDTKISLYVLSHGYRCHMHSLIKHNHP